jgi:hypothetical protein
MRREPRPSRGRHALFWLVVARLMLWLLPFRRIAPRLGEQGRESSMALLPHETERVEHVRNILFEVCRRVRWRPSCLVRSLAAMILLRREGLEGTLYLGVARAPGELRAHAWVRCGQVIVAGARGHRNFNVLNSFTRAL